MKRVLRLLSTSVLLLVPAAQSLATFHFMQIEQVIGGVNGDANAQAIQLRMRSAGQNVVSQGRLSVVNASGGMPVELLNMATNVANGGTGSRVLITTPSFATYSNIPLVSDFTMAAIPASYLAAGQLRFTDDFGTIYWSVSWGGAGFTGSTAGSFTNDSNGNFGPQVAVALPSTTLQALQFTGTATAGSTTNAAQYAVTAGAATFINNAGASFVVTLPSEPDPLFGDYNGDLVVDALDYTVWRNNLDTDFDLAGNGDEENASEGIVDEADFDLWKLHYGDFGDPPGSGGSAIPEPTALVSLLIALTLATTRRRTHS